MLLHKNNFTIELELEYMMNSRKYAEEKRDKNFEREKFFPWGCIKVGRPLIYKLENIHCIENSN